MQIRYYMSGFEPLRVFPDDLIEHFKRDIQKTDKIVYIPTDFSQKEKIEFYAKGLTDSFAKANLIFSDIVILNEEMTDKEMQEHINLANVIYLMGGNPTTQLEIISKYNLENSIRNTNAVVIGMSAGAMCMSKYSLMIPVSEKYSKTDIRPAMNLSNISIFPHYTSDGEVPEVLDNGRDEKIAKSDLLYLNQNYGDFYLIPDNSEIREQNGELTFIGNNIIFVSNGEFNIIKNSVPKETEIFNHKK